MDAEQAYRFMLNDSRLIGNNELESHIATCTFYSYRYAVNILKGRFILGEDTILKSPNRTFYYLTSIPGAFDNNSMLKFILNSIHKVKFMRWYLRKVKSII